MPKDKFCCQKCSLANKFLDNFEYDEILEFLVRELVNNAYDLGYKECLINDISIKEEILKDIESYQDEDHEEESAKPNLRVVDNINKNKH